LALVAAEVRTERPLSDIQAAIWRGHRLLTKLADNATLAQFYANLIDIAESLILLVDWPVDGEEREIEQDRVAAHARLFDAVCASDVAEAQRWGDIVRTVSPLGRDGQLVSINDGEPDRWENLLAEDEG
jgi:DNA-binding GntR family transcriptional regulator